MRIKWGIELAWRRIKGERWRSRGKSQAYHGLVLIDILVGYLHVDQKSGRVLYQRSYRRSGAELNILDGCYHSAVACIALRLKQPCFLFIIKYPGPCKLSYCSCIWGEYGD